jgi:hypothetical protein
MKRSETERNVKQKEITWKIVVPGRKYSKFGENGLLGHGKNAEP